MKLLAAVLAIAQAGQTEWVMNTWWAKANEVYNFAVANPAQFGGAIASVSDDLFNPLFNFCGGADGVADTAELTTCGGHIATFVGMSQGMNLSFTMGKSGIFDQNLAF